MTAWDKEQIPEKKDDNLSLVFKISFSFSVSFPGNVGHSTWLNIPSPSEATQFSALFGWTAHFKASMKGQDGATESASERRLEPLLALRFLFC